MVVSGGHNVICLQAQDGKGLDGGGGPEPEALQLDRFQLNRDEIIKKPVD